MTHSLANVMMVIQALTARKSYVRAHPWACAMGMGYVTLNTKLAVSAIAPEAMAHSGQGLHAM